MEVRNAQGQGTVGVGSGNLSVGGRGCVGDVYVTVYATPRRGGGVVLQLDVIEMIAMDAGMVTVSADRIAGEIARLGFVSIYDVYFVPDSDEIRGESASALREIAAFLNDNPELPFLAAGRSPGRP